MRDLAASARITSLKTATQLHGMRDRFTARGALLRLYNALDVARTASAKGEALESLARYLLDRVRGLRVVRRRLRTSSSEIDLVVEIVPTRPASTFEEFGRYILVECRNWIAPVRAKDVRDFVGKLSKSKTRLGIIFARSGVTGRRGDTDAWRETRIAFHTSDIVVLVVTDDDLRSMAEGAEFAAILAQKLFDFRFDR